MFSLSFVINYVSKYSHYLSENYMDYIIQYEGDIVAAVNAFGNSYVKVLDDTYAIISIRKERVDEFFKAVPSILPLGAFLLSGSPPCIMKSFITR